MSLDLALQYLVAGLTYGSIYAVVAIGFNIVYSATGIVNFAQGEFVMLGGMIAVQLSGWMPLPAAVAGAVAATAAVGALVEVAFLRWLRRPTVLRMVVITIGVSILIREGALVLWGEGVRSLPYFTGDEISAVALGGARVSPQVFWVLGTVALIVVALEWFYRRTLLGWEMQACAVNRDAAALCGVPVRRLVTLSFAMAAAIGALAGAVVSPITYTSYAAGGPLAIKGFTVAILGGLGNSGGAVAAGLALGVVESFAVSFLPAAYKDVVTLSLLLAVLVVRPSGLFASGEAARLKDF
ncbi:MAG TPA: branched-chain amino acid ABC transporter permease [Anaeromyxobacteraceae bacterium]|nr:branched-chain amino acid ABC transporter permease [Anaeromyxobacteraceae bacterium]